MGAFGGCAEDLLEPNPLGQAVLRSPRIPSPTEVLIVADIRPASPQLLSRNAFGEQARKPERIVAEVNRDLELTVAARRRQVRQNIHQVEMFLIIYVVDVSGSMPDPELPDNRREIVGDGAILDAHIEQGAPNQDVEQQGGGRSRQRRTQEKLADFATVEHLVETAGS